MTKTFTSFTEFAVFLGTLAVKEKAAEQVALRKVGELVEKAAKKKPGTYQPGWAPLAATTLDGWGPYPGKVALGYSPPDNPLLRDGTMRDSYQHSVGVGEVTIGSNLSVALFHELGTSKMPARPVLLPAATENIDKIKLIVGGEVYLALSGGRK